MTPTTSRASRRAIRMSSDSSSCPTKTNGSPAVAKAPVVISPIPTPTSGTSRSAPPREAPAPWMLAPPRCRARPASANDEMTSWIFTPTTTHSDTHTHVAMSATISRARAVGISLQNFSIVRPPRWIGSIDDHVANLQDGVWWGSDDIEHEGHDDGLHAWEGATLVDVAEWGTARIGRSDDESDEGHGQNQRTAAYALDPVAHILNTPKRVSGMGAWRAASRPNVRMRRVSSGSMTPSSQRRAVAKYGDPSRSYVSRIGASKASRSVSSLNSPRTVDRTRAACWPPMTEIRAFGHVHRKRGW